MKISAFCTETSCVALDMLEGYLRLRDPALFHAIEWVQPEEGSEKHFFFFDSMAALDKEAKAIQAIAIKSIPHLKVIMTEADIVHADPSVTAWSLAKLHQFLLA